MSCRAFARDHFLCICWARLVSDLFPNPEAIRASTSDFKFWGFFCLGRMRKEKQSSILTNVNSPEAHLCPRADGFWWELPVPPVALLCCRCRQGGEQPDTRLALAGESAQTRASSFAQRSLPVLRVPQHQPPAEPSPGFPSPRCMLSLLPSSLLRALPLCPNRKRCR